MTTLADAREFLAELISQLFHAGVLITEQAKRAEAIEAEVDRLRTALRRMGGGRLSGRVAAPVEWPIRPSLVVRPLVAVRSSGRWSIMVHSGFTAPAYRCSGVDNIRGWAGERRVIKKVSGDTRAVASAPTSTAIS